MSRQQMAFTDHFGAVLEALASRGLLLGTAGEDDRPNLMTIGWGSIGTAWGRPIWTVLVRPSRHTFAALERTGCFTLNVPPPSLAAACELCGTRSGRDVDKFAACGITKERASRVDAPVVAECPIVYECRVVHSNDVYPPRLAREIQASAYPRGDYHRVYWGEILAASADPDAAAILGSRRT